MVYAPKENRPFAVCWTSLMAPTAAVRLRAEALRLYREIYRVR